VITSFKHKGLQRFFTNGDHRGIPAVVAPRIARILDRLDVSRLPDEMNLPGFKFHALKGSHLGFFSVHVSGNWRITFCFDNHDAVAVNLEDYH
jgi:proteic killer suppression protein